MENVKKNDKQMKNLRNSLWKTGGKMWITCGKLLQHILDLHNGFPILRVFLKHSADLIASGHDGRMISAAKFLPYFYIGHI